MFPLKLTDESNSHMYIEPRNGTSHSVEQCKWQTAVMWQLSLGNPIISQFKDYVRPQMMLDMVMLI